MSRKRLFGYVGGKTVVSEWVVNNIFDDVSGAGFYYEPFFGSGSVWELMPYDVHKIVCEANGLLTNLWRSMYHYRNELKKSWYLHSDINCRALLENVAKWENDKDFIKRLEHDIHYCDKDLAINYLSWMYMSIHGGRNIQLRGFSGIHGKYDMDELYENVYKQLMYTKVYCRPWAKFSKGFKKLAHGFGRGADDTRGILRHSGMFLDPPYYLQTTNKQYKFDTDGSLNRSVVAFCLEWQDVIGSIAYCCQDITTDVVKPLIDAGWDIYQWKRYGLGVWLGKEPQDEFILYHKHKSLSKYNDTLF